MLIALLLPPVKQSRQHGNNISHLQLRSSLEVQGDVGSPLRLTSSAGLEQVGFQLHSMVAGVRPKAVDTG